MAQEALVPTALDEDNTDHAAAISLQELSSANIRNFSQNQINEGLTIIGPDDDTSAYELWNTEIWPMWREQQFIPFAVGGIPFDFNTDMPSI